LSSIREIPWGDCLLERRHDPEAERRYRRMLGRHPGALVYFLGVPWLTDQLATLSLRLTSNVHLDHQLSDLVGLVVSQDNSCRYCFAMQRAFLRILGFPEERIVQLEHDLMLASLDPATKASLEYARKVSRASPLACASDMEPLRAVGFTDDAIREIASIAVLHGFFNRLSTVPSLPPGRMEVSPDAWWSKGLRPFIAIAVRRYHRRDRPEPLREEDRTGPWAFVVASLDGLPFAHELRGLLDALWGSPILTRRCKALMFAVVARALGCDLSESESTALAGAEGLSPEQVCHILDHLAWEGLTFEEAVLVPFARETVWYETPRLQARAREVHAQLTNEQFIEATATLATANMVCRLAAALAPQP
jgi:AhpD family alkylhydroperoxidase